MDLRWNLKAHAVRFRRQIREELEFKLWISRIKRKRKNRDFTVEIFTEIIAVFSLQKGYGVVPVGVHEVMKL